LISLKLLGRQSPRNSRGTYADTKKSSNFSETIFEIRSDRDYFAV